MISEDVEMEEVEESEAEESDHESAIRALFEDSDESIYESALEDWDE